MQNIEDNKTEQINNIVSIVKLSALLFCGIICFKYIFNNGAEVDVMQQGAVGFAFFATLIILAIYFMWIFWTIKTNQAEGIKYKQVLENIIFMGIFLVMILLSGAHTSNYKFLFLFLVIANTIQSGLKHGMIIACISATTILMVDLVCYRNVVVNTYFEDDLILAGVFILTAWPLGYYVKIEKQHIEELTMMANCDGLTGIYNHRFFHDKITEMLEGAKEKEEPLAILFIDIDNFKYYNDLNGHQKGDEALRIIGKLLKDSIGDKGIVARYGGEEFAIILPNVGVGVIEVAEGIRKMIEDTYIIGQENQPRGNLTVSIGAAIYPDNATNDIDLIKSADDALYRAKFLSKNRVEMYRSILDDLKKGLNDEQEDMINSIKTLISVINARDKYTYGHSERTVLYSKVLAIKMGLNEEDTKHLLYGTYMHDIGKINIPEAILNKNGELTDEEWQIVKEHPKQGVEIIQTIDSLSEMAPLVMYHHERYDGKGYPRGLKGKEIPILARALTVVDSFDGMTSNRPYGRRKDYNEAFQELRRCSGTQFDPEIVEAFIEAVTENKEEFKKIH